MNIVVQMIEAQGLPFPFTLVAYFASSVAIKCLMWGKGTMGRMMELTGIKCHGKATTVTPSPVQGTTACHDSMQTSWSHYPSLISEEPQFSMKQTLVKYSYQKLYNQQMMENMCQNLIK